MPTMPTASAPRMILYGVGSLERFTCAVTLGGSFNGREGSHRVLSLLTLELCVSTAVGLPVQSPDGSVNDKA